MPSLSKRITGNQSLLITPEPALGCRWVARGDMRGAVGCSSLQGNPHPHPTTTGQPENEMEQPQFWDHPLARTLSGVTDWTKYAFLRLAVIKTGALGEPWPSQLCSCCKALAATCTCSLESLMYCSC